MKDKRLEEYKINLWNYFIDEYIDRRPYDDYFDFKTKVENYISENFSLSSDNERSLSSHFVDYFYEQWDMR